MTVGPAAPFRHRYLRHAEIEAQLAAWAASDPAFVRVVEIGKSREGRALSVLVIGREPDRRRPAVWVDGNMHATELSGSSVALAIAEDVIALHRDPRACPSGLSADAAAALREVVFYVLPRMSPDGAEAVLESGRYVRSNPRDDRPNRGAPRWVAGDVDGDGLALAMRVQDPGGEYVESRQSPGLMLPRTLEDEGPFYRVWPEGHIEGFDGFHVPDPFFLSDNETDLNRNFPYSWAPEPDQIGAGKFATSEPESRAVVEFTTAHPEIFAWLNLHTFGGVIIRPFGDQPDRKMPPSDLALYRQIEAWSDELLGYPTVSGFEEFLYEPDRPLRGDLSEYAFHQRGAIGYVVELWDLFTRLGMPRKKPFVDVYSHWTRADLENLHRFDREENAGRMFVPWRKAQHPQLGEVEVGGFDGRVGLSNPPYELLPDLCARHAAHFLRVAALAPRLSVTTNVRVLGEAQAAVDVDVANLGYLPTHVLATAKKLPWNEAPYLEVRAEGGLRLADPTDVRRALVHLDGWGRGRFDPSSSIFVMRGRGRANATRTSIAVSGHGRLVIRVGSCRLGFLERVVEL
jgi:hypothetical protein